MKFGFYVMGQKGFCALESFILEQGAEFVSWVICAKDKGVNNDWSEDIEALCKKLNLPVFDRRTDTDLSELSADVRYAVGWRWIIEGTGLLIVFHDSPLPKYRGFAPVVNMLIEGVDHLGVTALIASAAYDKGEVVGQEVTRIEYPIKIKDAISKVTPLYKSLMSRVTGQLLQTGRLESIPQDESRASYSLWRDDEDYLISWNWSAQKVKRFIDATGSPYKGASAIVKNSLVRVFDAIVIEDVSIEARGDSLGKVIFIEDGCPVVICGYGLLKLTELRSDEGGDLIGKIGMRTRFKGREGEK